MPNRRTTQAKARRRVYVELDPMRSVNEGPADLAGCGQIRMALGEVMEAAAQAECDATNEGERGDG